MSIEIDDSSYVTQLESGGNYSNHSASFYINGQPYVISALQGSDGGLYVYRVNDDGSYTLTGSMEQDNPNSSIVVLGGSNGGGEIYMNGVQTDVSSTFLANTQNFSTDLSGPMGVPNSGMFGNGIEDIDVVDINGKQFVFVNSQNGPGLTVWSVDETSGELAYEGGMLLGVNSQAKLVYGQEIYEAGDGTWHVFTAETFRREAANDPREYSQTYHQVFDPATGQFSERALINQALGDHEQAYATSIYETDDGTTWSVTISNTQINMIKIDPATGNVLLGTSVHIDRSTIPDDPGGKASINVITDANGDQHLLYASLDGDKIISVDFDNAGNFTHNDTIDANITWEFDNYEFYGDNVIVASTIDGSGTNDGIGVWKIETDGTLTLIDDTNVMVDHTAGNLIQTTDGEYWIVDPTTFNTTGGPMQSITFVCFTGNTLIKTEKGDVRANELSVGDQILTKDNGYKTLRWIGTKKVKKADLRGNSGLLPVKIEAGALGPNLPHECLHVSKQHRILVQSKIIERVFGVKSVLIPAIKLTSLPGVYVDEDADSVEYMHLLFDEHEIIMANGAWAESLFLGEGAQDGLGKEAMEEIYAIFPELRDMSQLPESCRIIVERGNVAKTLVKRHVKSGKCMQNLV